MTLKLTGVAVFVPAAVLAVLAALGTVSVLAPTVVAVGAIVVVLLQTLDLNPKVEVSAYAGTVLSALLALLAVLGTIPAWAPIATALTQGLTTFAAYMVSSEQSSSQTALPTASVALDEAPDP